MTQLTVVTSPESTFGGLTSEEQLRITQGERGRAHQDFVRSLLDQKVVDISDDFVCVPKNMAVLQEESAKSALHVESFQPESAPLFYGENDKDINPNAFTIRSRLIVNGVKLLGANHLQFYTEHKWRVPDFVGTRSWVFMANVYCNPDKVRKRDVVPADLFVPVLYRDDEYMYRVEIRSLDIPLGRYYPIAVSELPIVQKIVQKDP